MQKKFIFVAVQSVLVVLGILFVCGGPKILQLLVETRMLTLTPDAAMFATWQKSPYKVTFDVYLFNWTNHKQIRSQDIKPHFRDVGPYCFNKDVEKVNIVWNDNGTVTFQVRNTWYFDEERSNGTLDDEITTLNPLVLSTALKARDWSYFLKKPLSGAINYAKGSLHVTRTARELLFDGYDDHLLSILRTFADNIPDKMGFYAKRNASDDADGVFNVGAITEKRVKFGKLYHWNYKSELSHYAAQCEDFNSQVMFAPNPKEKLTTFLADICRAGILDYQKDVSVENVMGRKYIIDSSMLDNGTLHEENVCYCNGECMPSGVVNVTACKNAPAFWSLPHYYKADPIYRENIEGMRPDPSRHEFSVVLEPTTGIPLQITGTSQGNLLVRSDSAISILQDIPEFLAPTFWYEQKARIGPEQAAQLKLLLTLPTITFAIGFTLIFAGLFWMLFMIYQGLRPRNTRKPRMDAQVQIEQQIPLARTVENSNSTPMK